MDDSGDHVRNDTSAQLIEMRKLKRQIQQLQVELEEKDTEVYIAESSLKDAERKLKTEQAKFNNDLDEKQEKIDELEDEIKRLKMKVKHISSESSDENSNGSLEKKLHDKQKQFDALLDEMNNKDQQILEMEKELNKANMSEEKEIKYLKQELQDQMKILSGKEEKIKELKRNNERYITDIEEFRRTIGIQEDELITLREEVQNLKRHRQSIDSTNENDTSSGYLVQLMEKKDIKIAKLKQKLENMKNDQTAGSRNTNENVHTLLNEISLLSGIKIKNIDEAVNIIKDIIQKPQPKMRHGNRQTMSRDGGDQARQIFEENDHLKDKVTELQRKLDTQTKKHKKILAEKEEEMQEIREEVEELRRKNAADYKTKNQLSSLKEKVQELEYQLGTKDEEIETQVQKCREVERKYTDKVGHIDGLNAQISEFQKQARELTKTNNKLEKTIEDKNNELQKHYELNHKIENDLQDKKKAIDTIKIKMADNKERADQLDKQLQQKFEENQHLVTTNQKLATENRFFKTKIENQEKEIGLMRMNNRQMYKPGDGRPNSGIPANKDGFPNWWDLHKDH